MEFSNKSERLASATYLITSFFGDQEPLKWKLRTLASELTSLSVSISDELVKEKDALLSESKNIVLKMSKLFSVAKNAGLVSSDNYDLMKAELKKHIDTTAPPATLSNFFNIEAPRAVETGEKTLMIKDKNENPAPEKESPTEEKKPLKNFGAISVKKNSRQSTIIGLLKRKKEIMIKDVSPLINGCSDKTIQRELASMVKSGILKKMGEKRWSRYSLA